MRVLALLLLLLFVNPAAAGEWSVGPAPGEPPDSRTAWVEDGSGHLLILRNLRVKGDHWYVVELKLAGGAVFGDDLPTTQIDGGKILEIDWQLDHEQYGRTWGKIDAGTASWTLLVTTRNITYAGDILEDWVKGKSIAIAYTTSDGAAHVARFGLTGMKDALLALTDIKIED
jgi:hypothetical protein